MFVKPAKGFVVRDPDRLDLIEAEGRHVPDHHDYWIRRVRDGDVEVCDPPAETEVTAEAKELAPADDQKAIGDAAEEGDGSEAESATPKKGARGK